MSEQLNAPSQVSIGNSLAAPEFASDTGFTNAPVWRDFESMAIVPTGEQQPLDFLNEPYDPSWPESTKNRWEEYNFGGVGTTPSGAAQRTLADMEAERKRAATMQDEQMKAQREREAQANDPLRQAEVKTKQLEAAQKQAEMQMPYLTELQYQDVLTRLRNPDLSFLEKQQLIAQANGYASMIAQMQPNTGKSAAALGPAATAIGKINPINDYGPQIDGLMRSSESRMAIARQALDATGVPLPEFKGAPPPPEPNQLVVEQFGMKRDDGTPITFRGAPVIRTVEGGKDVYERLGTDGKFYTLTEKEIAELTGGQ
jgi:hypothetical protein